VAALILMTLLMAIVLTPKPEPPKRKTAQDILDEKEKR